MIIDLASLGKSPKVIEVGFGADDIDLDGEALLHGSAFLTAEVTREGTRTDVRGKIKADAILDCTRCLEPIDRTFDLEFDDIFVDASEESTQDETEVGMEHLDEELLTGGEIDLKNVVREQLLLALPEQIFCKDDCKGLCPQCGENRNLIDCSCDDDEVDPRWAALKEMKNRK